MFTEMNSILKSRSICAVSFLSLALLVMVPTSAFALAGLLSRPSIAFSTNSKPSHDMVMKVLANKKYKFVTGSFVNWSTTMWYSGNAADLTEFLDGLAQFDGLKLLVKYSKDRGVADTTRFGKAGKKTACQWRVDHCVDKFTITIYLGDAKIKKKDVTIPPGVVELAVKKSNKRAKTTRT